MAKVRIDATAISRPYVLCYTLLRLGDFIAENRILRSCEGLAEGIYCNIRIRIPARILRCVSKKDGLNPWQTAYLWLGGLYVTAPPGTCRVNASGICDGYHAGSCFLLPPTIFPSLLAIVEVRGFVNSLFLGIKDVVEAFDRASCSEVWFVRTWGGPL